MDDESYMVLALKAAKEAWQKGEVPVGAIIVYENEIIAEAHNQVELLQDATAHSEMLCLKIASSVRKNFRLKGCTLYVTLEPCIMCLGAILLSRVERLVYGAKDLRHGALGSFVNLLEKKHPTHQLEVKGLVLEQQSASLLRAFFQEQRCKKSN